MVLDVGVDALVQVEEFVVNLAIALVGLEEFHVPGAFHRDAEVGKDPTCFCGLVRIQVPSPELQISRVSLSHQTVNAGTTSTVKSANLMVTACPLRLILDVGYSSRNVSFTRSSTALGLRRR